jgi:hypothetical protein
MILYRLVFPTLLLLLISIPAQAQSQNSKEEDPKKILEKRALELLDEVVGNSKALKAVENRVNIQMDAAQLLWRRDEKRARELFKEATVNFVELLNNADVNSSDYQTTFQAINILRMELLQTISHCDSVLALEFIRSTRPLLPPHPYQDDRQQQEFEQQLEINLATQIAEKSPQKALEIAKEMLATGLPPDLVNILHQLLNKDRETAAKLASELISKLQTENLEKNPSARYIAIQIANTYRASIKKGDDEKNSSIFNETTYRALIERIVSAALNISIESNYRDESRLNEVRAFLSELSPILPDIERYLPSRAASVKTRLEKFKINEQREEQNEYGYALENGSIDDLLKAASKAPPELRSSLFYNAAYKAVSEGDIDRAQKIIGTNIPNQFQRAEAMRNLNQQLLARVTEEKNLLEKAEKIVSQLSPEERARALHQLAATVMARGKEDKDTALELLNNAWALAGGKAEDYNQLSTQIQIAGVYANLQPEKSFEILEQMIDQVNDLISAASVLDGFNNDGQKRFRGGELLFQSKRFQGELSMLMPLVHKDFDRALSIADKLQRNETRLLGRFLVVVGALSYHGEQ